MCVAARKSIRDLRTLYLLLSQCFYFSHRLPVIHNTPATYHKMQAGAIYTVGNYNIIYIQRIRFNKPQSSAIIFIHHIHQGSLTAISMNRHTSPQYHIEPPSQVHFWQVLRLNSRLQCHPVFCP